MMLADDAQPLKLADGRLVYPGGRVVEEVAPPSKPSPNDRMVEIPTNREAQELVINARRKLADLPDVPKTMNAISVVLSYSLFGLDNMDIALAIGSTEIQVGKIKESSAYKTMHENVLRSILDAETDVVRDIFKQHSRTAANVLVDSLHNGQRGERLFAAKDFLDRAGHRPSDIVEHRHRIDGGLTIEIVRKDASDQPPTIDMEIE
jgi:hypothetical protein